jgi:hypothetical protein
MIMDLVLADATIGVGSLGRAARGGERKRRLLI